MLLVTINLMVNLPQNKIFFASVRGPCNCNCNCNGNNNCFYMENCNCNGNCNSVKATANAVAALGLL